MNARFAPAVEDDVVRRLISVGDLRRMTDAGIIEDDENVELIDGELFVMAAKGIAHELMKSALIRHFVTASSEDIFVGVEASLRLGTHVLVEPDILVCRRPDVVAAAEGYIGVPGREILLVVEVADTTLRKDRGRKAAIYARYAVPDYWIIDTNARVVWRHLDPSAGGYGSIQRTREDVELRPIAPEIAHAALRLVDLP